MPTPMQRHPILVLGTLLPLALALSSSPQEDAASAGVLGVDVAARVGDQTITLDEYKEHLLRAYGREPLGALIDRKLLRAEAARRGVEVPEEELESGVEKAWSSYLVRLEGDEARFAAELERGGFQVDEYRALLRDRVLDEMLLQALCRATRVVTDEDIEARFRLEYGPDGDKVEVRHVFLNPARLRADLIAQGTPAAELTERALDERLRETCEDVLAELESGGDFGELARTRGHDIGARVTGGALANYNYRAYGEEFADAVRSAKVGVPVGPVRTQAGYHVIEVTSRVHTDLEDVREDLRATLADEAATFAEMDAMRESLRAAVEIETY